MSLIKSDFERSKEFGQLMSLVALIIGALYLRKSDPSCLYPFSVSLVLLLASTFVPLALLPLERAWMAFAEKLSTLMTLLAVMLTYVLAIIPIGLLLKLFRKDLLGLRIERDRASYWEHVEAEGPGSRHFSPF